MTKKKYNPLGNKKKLIEYTQIEPPFLIIDEIIHHQFHKKVITLVDLKPTNWYFKCHFIDNPVMPGHLTAEAMVQTASLLFGQPEKNNKEEKRFFLTSSKIRFLEMVKPGGRMRLVAKPVKILSFAAITSVKAYVKRKIVAEGEFMNVLIDKEQLKNEHKKK